MACHYLIGDQPLSEPMMISHERGRIDKASVGQPLLTSMYFSQENTTESMVGEIILHMGTERDVLKVYIATVLEL